MELSLNEQLQQITAQLNHLLPEVTLSIAFIVLILADLFKCSTKWLQILTALALIGAGGLCVSQHEEGIFLMADMLYLDKYTLWFKLIVIAAALLTVWLETIKNELRGEIYAILLAVVMALLLLVAAKNLLLIYLSIEMLSVCSYLLAGFGLNKKSSESALKYILFGAFSSALMLYGMSLLYGMTGTLNITYTDAIGQLANVSAFPLMLAIVLTVCGFLFKIAAVPFHSWSPDVYEGTPVSIVAFFSVAPKLGGLVVLYDVSNILLHYFNAKYAVSWASVVAVIALASMIVGNTAALQQQNIKRMLAYSSIAQAGFMLCCVVAYSGYGTEVQALTFYAVAYMLANFVVFALLAFTGKENLQDYGGTGRKNVFVSVAVIVAFLALTGLPPTAGFMAKFLVFANLWQTWAESGDKLLLILFIGGILNAVISLFYYVKVPYYAFFKPENETPASIKINAANYAVVALLTLFSLFFFSKADLLLSWLQ